MSKIELVSQRLNSNICWSCVSCVQDWEWKFFGKDCCRMDETLTNFLRNWKNFQERKARKSELKHFLQVFEQYVLVHSLLFLGLESSIHLTLPMRMQLSISNSTWHFQFSVHHCSLKDTYICNCISIVYVCLWIAFMLYLL